MMKQLAQYKVNGQYYDAIIEPHMLLADVLREQFRLTGTKRACSSGNCGACTVIIDGQSICSCITLAITARDKTIETVEGLAAQNGELSALQRAFVKNNAAQCGYCTSGMLMTISNYLKANPRPTIADAKHAISGNICRCTGYVKIIDAIMDAAQELQQESETTGAKT